MHFLFKSFIMKKITLFVSFLVFIFQTSIAQEKLLTMEEAVVKQRNTLAPTRLTQLMWVRNTDSYSYVNPGEAQELFICNASDGKVTQAVSLAILNEEVKKMDLTPFKNFPEIKWKNEKQFSFDAFKDEKHLFLVYDIKTKKIINEGGIESAAKGIDISDKTRFIAFTEIFTAHGRTWHRGRI